MALLTSTEYPDDLDCIFLEENPSPAMYRLAVEVSNVVSSLDEQKATTSSRVVFELSKKRSKTNPAKIRFCSSSRRL